MRRWLLFTVLWLLPLSGFAQSGPELDALLEAFFAKDLSSLSRHLPPEVADVIRQLPLDARQELSERYLFAAQAERQGAKLTQPGNGAVVVVDRTAGGENSYSARTEIYLEKYLSGGGETMLRFRTRQTESPSSFRPDWSLTAWLRFVEDEWRVYELDVDGREIHLDDPQYLEYLKRPRPSANEGSAIGALRTINTAAVTYSSTFPDIGFPESLEVLGLPPQAEAAGDDEEGSGNTSSPNHAGLVDETLSTPPFEKSGYRFAYSKKSELEYSVTARPVRFGVSGTTNYFTDESGVIRFTREDREPTVEDDPLQ